MGWAGTKNGELIWLAQEAFDVFVTVDRNLSFQQHLPQFKIRVIILKAVSNRLDDLVPFAPLILDSLSILREGETALLEL